MKKIIVSITQLFLPIFLGSIIGIVISGMIDYTQLNQPPLAPSKSLFPIVWTIIYLLMGISYFIFKRENKDAPLETFVYYMQLFINLLWSIIFFVLKWRFISVIWILLLDIFVIYLIYLFFQKNKIAAYLNIPYLLWILFATYLTIGIYLLN